MMQILACFSHNLENIWNHSLLFGELYMCSAAFLTNWRVENDFYRTHEPLGCPEGRSQEPCAGQGEAAPVWCSGADHIQLLGQCLMAVGQTDIGNIRLSSGHY
jgi:hypothetical protein